MFSFVKLTLNIQIFERCVEMRKHSQKNETNELVFVNFSLDRSVLSTWESVIAKMSNSVRVMEFGVDNKKTSNFEMKNK